MTRLRFCMVTTFYPPFNFGGDGIGVQRLSQALVRRGHDVTVVHDGDAFVQLAGAEPVAAAPDDGVRVVTLRSRAPRLSLLATHQLGRPVVHRRRLRALLGDPSIDVINFHNVSLVGGPGVLAVGTALKAYMAHEHWLVCPTHVLWRHGRERCTGRECVRCVLRHRRPPQVWRYTRSVARHARHVDIFIAMSAFSAAKHREFGFEQPMEVLPYFLPDTPRDTAGAAAPHARPYFLFVGRLERIKGLDDVIPVFRGFPDADLLIAGDGDHGPALRALADGIPGVRFLGRLAPEALRHYYRHARALIVPSVCFETFGIILIEAFREGVPVIARRVGPLPEIVEQAGAGMLFDNAADLRRTVAGFLNAPERRAALATAGRTAFERYWTESAVVPAYFRILERAARRTGRAGLAETLREGAAA